MTSPWLFDPWDLTKGELVLTLSEYLRNRGLFGDGGLPESATLAFLQAIADLYKDNPYHNFYHCVDVTQACYAMLAVLTEKELPQLPKTAEIALLLAAILHDVDHDGLNNTCHLRDTQSVLHQRYQLISLSILEYHHCELSKGLLEQYGILSQLESETQELVWGWIQTAIMNTDIALHVPITETLPALYPDPLNNIPLLLTALLKLADISNTTRNFDICQKWAVKLSVEFDNIHSKLTSLSNNSSPNSTSLTATPLNTTPPTNHRPPLPPLQIGFIHASVKPFLGKVVYLFPSLAFLAENADANMLKWKALEVL